MSNFDSEHVSLRSPVPSFSQKLGIENIDGLPLYSRACLQRATLERRGLMVLTTLQQDPSWLAAVVTGQYDGKYLPRSSHAGFLRFALDSKPQAIQPEDPLDLDELVEHAKVYGDCVYLGVAGNGEIGHVVDLDPVVGLLVGYNAKRFLQRRQDTDDVDEHAVVLRSLRSLALTAHKPGTELSLEVSPTPQPGFNGISKATLLDRNFLNPVLGVY